MAYFTKLSKKLYIMIIAVSAAVSFFVLFYMHKHNNAAVSHISQQIYEVLDLYRVPYDIDAHSIDLTIDTTPQAIQGVEQCIQNITHFVAYNRPIQMLLVGFPFKSSNREQKVLGHLPDMAERKSLEYLQEMLNKIKKAYKPGAKVLIFCDGIPFADLFEIPIADVIAYEKALKLLAADMHDITLFTSEDMIKMHKLTSISQIVEFIDQYEPSNEQFKASLQEVPKTTLKRFALELDHPQGHKLIEKYTLQDIVMRLLAREMRLRTYLTHVFPSPTFFRLTVHLSTDVSKKFGIRLSPTSDITPYHGILVEEADGTWVIRFKKDVNEHQYIVHSRVINGVTCTYFKHK